MLVVDPLDPPDELAAHPFEPGLLGQLPHDRLGEGLARPRPGRRAPTTSPAAGPRPRRTSSSRSLDHDDGADGDRRGITALGAP